MFIIGANADGYGVDRCLAAGAKCGAAAADAYCRGQQYKAAATYQQGRPRRHHRRHPERRLRRLPRRPLRQPGRDRLHALAHDPESGNRFSEKIMRVQMLGTRSDRLMDQASQALSGTIVAAPGLSPGVALRARPRGTKPPHKALARHLGRGRAMKILLLNRFGSLFVVLVPPGALSRRLAALRAWSSQRNFPPRQ